MRSSTLAQPKLARPAPAWMEAVLAAFLGVALFLIGLAVVVVVYDYTYAGRIYPGVSVGGVDLTGLPPEEAIARLSAQITYPQSGKVVFQEGKSVWVAKPADLGLYLDPLTSARAAYSLGRTGPVWERFFDQFDAWYSGRSLPPLLIYDERAAQAYLSGIAEDVDKPTIEAGLKVNGVEVVSTPGQVGRAVDVNATLRPLAGKMTAMTDMLLPLVVVNKPPAILDANQQAAQARQILSAPLTLQLPGAQEGDPGPWTVAPEDLAKMLTIERVEAADGAHYQVGLNAEGLRATLESLAPKLARDPRDARFTFNPEAGQLEVIQESVTGRRLDVNATIQAINEKLAQGEHTLPLILKLNEPQVSSTATAEQLGIREQVSQQTTYFYGSSKARIQNITTAAAQFNGLLVPPGAVFSMASSMGDVSLDNGYAEALIIYGNRTIQGVGGGVCQVSTTLFRTVMYGGFPVVERNPHAYRVYYYEQTAAGGDDPRKAGMDATVFVPVVDFKFKNDTPYWLLMETQVNGYSLTWTFYSTSDGRSVEIDSSGLQNITPPPDPVYTENPDLPAGEIKQVDWEVEGADITISRTVSRDGQVYFTDNFSTHYLPWASVFEYGPGAKIPKDKNQNSN